MRILNSKYFVALLALIFGLIFQLPSIVSRVSATVPGNNNLVTLDSSGNQSNGDMDDRSVTSGDGRYIAYASFATNLVTGDTNAKEDVFIRDTTNSTTSLISQSTGSTLGNNNSHVDAISYDGRFVLFSSTASNLVTGDTNSVYDIFVRDTLNNTTTLVSTNTSGTIGDRASDVSDMSADGRFVVFSTSSTNFIATSSSYLSLYLKDLKTGTLKLLSVDSSGTEGNNTSTNPKISCDGGIVVFESTATNLVPGDTNAKRDVFISTMPAGTNNLTDISLTSTSDSYTPSVSCNGNNISFFAAGDSLVASDANSNQDILTYNRLTSTFGIASMRSTGAQISGCSVSSPNLSGDGQYVVFYSDCTNLVTGDTNNTNDVFVRDIKNATTQVVSKNSSGTISNGTGSVVPAISGDGKYITFSTYATNLGPTDTNVQRDIYRAESGF